MGLRGRRRDRSLAGGFLTNRLGPSKRVMSESWSIPIVGLEVTSCRLDKVSFVLHLATVSELCVIRIDEPFELIGADCHKLAPDKPSELGPALTAIRRSVRRAEIDSTGMLIIEIDGTGTFRVPPSPEYEGWEVVGPRRSRWVSIAGGEVVHWPEEP